MEKLWQNHIDTAHHPHPCSPLPPPPHTNQCPTSILKYYITTISQLIPLILIKITAPYKKEAMDIEHVIECDQLRVSISSVRYSKYILS